jgi:hypothetical protein
VIQISFFLEQFSFKHPMNNEEAVEMRNNSSTDFMSIAYSSLACSFLYNLLVVPCEDGQKPIKCKSNKSKSTLVTLLNAEQILG